MAPRRRRLTYDSSRFTSEANSHWYDTHVDNGFIVERPIHPELEAHFDISNAFRALGWEPVVTFAGPYYPNLVREFYANIEPKNESGPFEIRSTVRGIPIILTRAYISELLGVSDEGDVYVKAKDTFHGDSVSTDLSFSITAASTALALGRTNRGWSTTNLGARERIIVAFISSNVSPRASGLNEMRFVDIYLLYKILHGLDAISGLPLSGFIISAMRDVVKIKRASKNFCFPCLLMRIFRDIGVPLDAEEVGDRSPNNIISPGLLKQWDFTFRGGQWRKLREGERHQDPPAAEAPPEVPEAAMGGEASSEATTHMHPPRPRSPAVASAPPPSMDPITRSDLFEFRSTLFSELSSFRSAVTSRFDHLQHRVDDLHARIQSLEEYQRARDQDSPEF